MKKKGEGRFPKKIQKGEIKKQKPQRPKGGKRKERKKGRDLKSRRKSAKSFASCSHVSPSEIVKS